MLDFCPETVMDRWALPSLPGSIISRFPPTHPACVGESLQNLPLLVLSVQGIYDQSYRCTSVSLTLHHTPLLLLSALEFLS